MPGIWLDDAITARPAVQGLGKTHGGSICKFARWYVCTMGGVQRTEPFMVAVRVPKLVNPPPAAPVLRLVRVRRQPVNVAVIRKCVQAPLKPSRLQPARVHIVDEWAGRGSGRVRGGGPIHRARRPSPQPASCPPPMLGPARRPHRGKGRRAQRPPPPESACRMPPARPGRRPHREHPMPQLAQSWHRAGTELGRAVVREVGIRQGVCSNSPAEWTNTGNGWRSIRRLVPKPLVQVHCQCVRRGVWGFVVQLWVKVWVKHLAAQISVVVAIIQLITLKIEVGQGSM